MIPMRVCQPSLRSLRRVPVLLFPEKPVTRLPCLPVSWQISGQLLLHLQVLASISFCGKTLETNEPLFSSMEVCTVVHITRQRHQGASMVWPWLLVEVGRIEGLGGHLCCCFTKEVNFDCHLLYILGGSGVFCFTFKNVCGHLMFKLVMLTFLLHCACS